MNTFKKLIIYTLNIPLYLISKFIPKDKNIWIFGAWFGNKYTDNSKYLFEYINENHPEIKAIWLTNDQMTLDLIGSKGYDVYKMYSLKGYYYSLRASFGFVSTGFKDINNLVFRGKYINLWHGNPLKKIVYDDKLVNGIQYHSFPFKVIGFLFPFIGSPEKYDYIIASSKSEANNLSTAFHKALKNILITGLPRNDVFSKHTKKEIKKVIYMPTHRNQGELNIKELLLMNMDSLDRKLSALQVELYIKLHYYHMSDMNLEKYTNIFLIKDDEIQQDIYSVINDFDILITDYSSIFFDYLLSGNPIIFAPFDYDQYISKDRELYYDYDEVTPGPKCSDWSEVAAWIEKFKYNPKLYEEERKKVTNKFHKYQDGKSAQRVYDEVHRINQK